jgi:hypothetical protein
MIAIVCFHLSTLGLPYRVPLPYCLKGVGSGWQERQAPKQKIHPMKCISEKKTNIGHMSKNID